MAWMNIRPKVMTERMSIVGKRLSLREPMGKLLVCLLVLPNSNWSITLNVTRDYAATLAAGVKNWFLGTSRLEENPPNVLVEARGVGASAPFCRQVMLQLSLARHSLKEMRVKI
jgi:hypothetical protein